MSKAWRRSGGLGAAVCGPQPATLVIAPGAPGVLITWTPDDQAITLDLDLRLNGGPWNARFGSIDDWDVPYFDPGPGYSDGDLVQFRAYRSGTNPDCGVVSNAITYEP